MRSTRAKSSNGAYYLPTPGAFSLGFDYPDGFLQKANKAASENLLHKNVQQTERIPSNAVPVIGGISLFQKVNADLLPFGYVAVAVLNMALERR